MKLDGVSEVNNTEEGVSVHLTGDIERTKVEAMIEKCGTGTCNCCGPEFVEALDGIDVSGEDGSVTMHIKGPVDKEIICDKLSQCDCYDA